MIPQDYYVYAHIGKTTNEIFYIGKGRGIRSRVKKSRPKYWHDAVAREDGYTIKHLHESLSEKEALRIEQILLESTKTIVNRTKKHSIRKVSFDSVSEKFYYDDSSPSGLRWKIKPRGCAKNIGDIAGNYRPDGYWEVSMNETSLLSHRVVYSLTRGIDISDGVVNHIDCNPHNNSAENLELITQIENLQRTSITKKLRLSRANRSGVNGVTTVCISGYIYHQGYIHIDGKRYSKSFSINKYENSLELAIQWRTKMELFQNELLKAK